ncbi:phosphotransferase family protein [Zavarzinia sp. CC-PAN008]|uniref:phosphotransferase family protein n=1 Tax=Zavarzinia sp. CC-PAN008 TaxID=3243332 RepID=UPI003F74837B
MTQPLRQRLAAGEPAFEAWLADRLGWPAVRLTDLGTPSGGGWSNETVFLTARHDGAARELVLKIAPQHASMFRDYDLTREHACMTGIGQLDWPPVPEIVGEDWGGTVLGRPAYVMARVAGQVPADDRPSFMEAGWLFDASEAEQRLFHDECIAALASLHAVDVAGLGLDRLARTTAGATALAREVAWLHDLFQWGRGAQPQPVLDRGFAWAREHLPDFTDRGLLWGDARPANMVVRDFRIAALLDWELATLGPPEFDLFWFLEMNRMRARGRPLPGFRDEADAIRLYQDLSGRTVRDAAWFRHHAALRTAVLMLRHLLVRVAAGDMPPDHPVLTDNVALRRLTELQG